MLRYVLLSVFALLLLTACGGSDLDKFEQSLFSECVECDLYGVDLSQAVLYRADLTGAYLSVADLTGADLTRADLTDARLAGADLNGANLYGAILDDVIGADLTGALNVPKKYLKD